ncbi:MAG TPA: rRNA pseudouridine synthase [Nitrospirae bacterium]|nr:ribosomal large subunit pseudouridine synthase B [bacterium BMS3Abin10]GBE39723.1 ribosomal large subunit pseudouridine synthase B [bacterium BMS3Bbin08]HDH04491.1 rRNA pseudouridine synthase [Nitrospirota bacterium]HDK17630.1 rRNA pseudouridine synthase [Nitrospirota bacterium]HDO26091.1 rRNA pseudouridine synthase [Nitrospirota bacterium]
MQERLQKILSKCGIASRRKAEEIILDGQVTVNGAIATIGMKADFQKDHIKVRGKLIIKGFGPKVYLMLNKPDKCITSLHDPEGRPTVKDFLKGVKAGVFPVGRLDYNSEGLLILTNDGDLANSILHPAKKIDKTYLVKINGVLEDKDILKLERGIKLDDGRKTAPARIRKVKKTGVNSWIEITIHEGKKRQIRRMLERVGHSVIRLRRTKVNGLELGRLPAGAFRYLTPEEIRKLKKEAVGN